MPDELVPGHAAARLEQLFLEELAGLGGVEGGGGKNGLNGGGEEFSEQIRKIIHRGEAEVVFAGPVGKAFAAGGRRDVLVFFDEVPPKAVEVLGRVSVELTFECGHDKHPAAEDQLPTF